MTRKILIADDHHVVRVGTSVILEENFDDLSIDYAETYYEVKEKVQTEKFDLIILDIDLPGSTYKSMIKELKSIDDEVLILLFSSYQEDIAFQYFEEGANGFLNKLSDDETFVKAVTAVFKDNYYFPPSIMGQLAVGRSGKKSTEKLLSKREFQIFNLLAKGNGNLEIANMLGIEVSTVGTYKKRIYAKLNISNIVELVKLYNEVH